MTAQDAKARDKAVYTDFDEFLKTAIHEYYEHAGKRNKASFIALLVASGEMTSLAVDSLKSGKGAKKLALGAASVIALRIGLRYALSGPLGIVLAGAAAASLIAYFVRHRSEVIGRIGTYRKLVAEVRQGYEKLHSDHRDGRLDAEQRDLMIDGLMKRFLEEVDQPAT